jgi:(1->4)-alpha-D-glucan 1-alpha-D-glucosylmutase
VRRGLLKELEAGMAPEAILARMGDMDDHGVPKLWLVRQGLHLRRRRPEAFGAESDYRPLLAEGPRADHAVAFSRGGAVVAVAPRLVLRLGHDWQGTTLELPAGRWRDVLTGAEVDGGARPVAELLAGFPVALLERL